MERIIGKVQYKDKNGVDWIWQVIVEDEYYYTKFGSVGNELKIAPKERCKNEDDAVKSAEALYGLKMAVLHNGKYSMVKEIKI